MNGRENEDLREQRRRERDDEGWVYPERMPGGRFGEQSGSSYGYNVRGARPARRMPPQGAPARQTPPPARTGAAAGGARRTAPPQNYGRAPAGYRPGAQGAVPPQSVRRAAPQGRGQIPPQNRGAAPGRRPASGGPPYRAGIRTPEGSVPEKKINYKLIAVIALIAFFLILAIIIVSGKRGKGAEEKPAPVSEAVVSGTEAPETEPEPPRSVYAERTADTKQLGTEISCTHAILIDVDENRVVAEKGGDERIFPASMTKVMTALVAADKCADLNSTFTMTYEIVAPLLEQNATSAGFTPGEVITVRDLLYGALLPSGADGTGGLAVYTSGSEAAFADEMNKKCAELGLTGTHFMNASGLHNDLHYSTCHDIALIFKAAMENADIAAAAGAAEYVTTKTAEHPEGIELHHTLFYERLEGREEFDGKIEVIGGKTGYTDEAGNCLVTMAKVLSTGKRYIFVCAGGDGKWAPVFDTIHVYRNYCGEHYDGEFIPKSQKTS